MWLRAGENDSAFEWLERAYDEHDGILYWLKAVPVFDPLRTDPRFDNLAGRLGLPDCGGLRRGPERPSPALDPDCHHVRDHPEHAAGHRSVVGQCYSCLTISTEISTAGIAPLFSSQCVVFRSSGQPTPGP
jgi:hypothetical protein